ncbi:MAG: tRNA adenosine(34) deaminase TadA [Clostridiales bacterium]|nr:tRNA adenosine(34) deaminase TadA [Clostridiales bacterium]MDY4061073.1 tRNA adenosine(34) deaminase TadA [Anaerovoracaceae bacterium]
MNYEEHSKFMKEALKEADKAAEMGEVPVGAVIVKDSVVIGRGFNKTETALLATSHAEIEAISQAAEYLGNWRLSGCSMYVTLEPCAMCAGAAVLSRIENLFYGAADPKFGGCESIFQIPTDKRLNHRINVVGGLMADESSRKLRDFFRNLRNRKNIDKLKKTN